MKTLSQTLLIGLLAINFLLPQISEAQMGNRQFGKGGGNCGMQGSMGTGWLLQENIDSLRFEVISKLSDKPLTIIKEDMQNKPLWAVLDSYGVKFQTFQTELREQNKLLVKKAASNGTITQDQAEMLLDRMSAESSLNQTYGMKGRRSRMGNVNKGNCWWNQ